jgi:hypothetical protein
MNSSQIEAPLRRGSASRTFSTVPRRLLTIAVLVLLLRALLGVGDMGHRRGHREPGHPRYRWRCLRPVRRPATGITHRQCRDTVKRGQVIGRLRNSGNTPEADLHFQVDRAVGPSSTTTFRSRSTPSPSWALSPPMGARRPPPTDRPPDGFPSPNRHLLAHDAPKTSTPQTKWGAGHTMR